MRLAYITRAYPYAELGETFLGPEIRALASVTRELHVIPVRPHLQTSVLRDAGDAAIFTRMSLSDARVLGDAMAEFTGNPHLAIRALRALLAPRYRTPGKLKNLAVFPKALAVARYVRSKHIDHIHAHWLTTPATVAYVASMMTGIPWSCTGHAHDIFADNLLPEKAASAQFVRIISRRNGQSFNDFTSDRATPRARVIHVGVDVPPTPFASAERSELRILCPARFHPMKGHGDLLHALAMLKDAGVLFLCDLAGDGELRGDLQAQVARLGLEGRVRFRGALSHEQLLHELQGGSYDVVALASVEDDAVTWMFEGIPVALIEAMAAGVPCVATRVGSVNELVDSHCGILVEQHNPASLAAALARLAREPNARRRLGSAARSRVQRDFDVRATTRALYDLIRGDVELSSYGPSNASAAGQ